MPSSTWGGPRIPLPGPTPTPTPTPTPASSSVVHDWDEFLVATATAAPYQHPQDADGGVAESWGDPYATNVICQITNMASNRVVENDRIVSYDSWKIKFNQNFGFGLQDKITWTDPVGVDHVAFVVGVTDRTRHSVQGLCLVMAEERT